MGRKSKYSHLIGKTFGNLQVIDFSGKTTKNAELLVKNIETDEYFSVSGYQLEKRRVNGISHKEASFKQKVSKNNTSGVKGVSFIASRNKWKASIGINGKNKTIGWFSTKEEAIAARLAAEEKYFKSILDKYKKENSDG